MAKFPDDLPNSYITPGEGTVSERVIDWSKHPSNWPDGDWHTVRDLVIHRDNATCQYCGAQPDNLDVDHIIPKSRGGDNSADNLVAACQSCNRSKGARTPVEWMEADNG